MKKYFFLGVSMLILFEAANVYFIMPMPGSQESETLGIAYFLYTWRWAFRALAILLMGLGAIQTWKYSRVLALLFLLMAAGVGYFINYKMAADTMFLQPRQVTFLPQEESEVDVSRLVIGIEHHGTAKAYPIQYLGYHHQVKDSIGDKPVIVTYCTVCRTGRVYEPMVKGHVDHFRLVGMDHFNAMFEDASTKTWWRQVNGVAVAGPLKGQTLPEWPSWQGTLETWLTMYPNSLILQPDPGFADAYEGMDDFERGRITGHLTRYDTASWKDKSWVIGIEIDGQSKAYDWNDLKTQRVIHDEVAQIPLVMVLGTDNQSFFAFKRQHPAQQFVLRNDTLTDGHHDFNFAGMLLDTSGIPLTKLNAYQEYWHSWRTFHPTTDQYQ